VVRVRESQIAWTNIREKKDMKRLKGRSNAGFGVEHHRRSEMQGVAG
jgi:hypothetical protein